MLLPKHHFLALECPRQSEYQHSRHTQIHDHGQKNFHRLIAKRKIPFMHCTLLYTGIRYRYSGISFPD